MRGVTPAVPLDWAGTAAVVDLEAACELYGRDSLPYPLGRSRPVGSVWLLKRDVAAVEDRLNDGDLGGVRPWVESYSRHNLSVGCRVRFSEVGTPDIRVHGLMAGDLGFVAVQRADTDGVDIVDLYSVPPGDVSAVIADSVGLISPGFHARIAIAGLQDRLPAPPESVDEYDDFGFPITRAESDEPAVHLIDGLDVVAVGTMKSPRGETRHWVTVDADGDYLYAPNDVGYAEPVDLDALRGYRSKSPNSTKSR